MASPQAKRGEAQLQLLDPPTGGGTQPGGNIGTAITFQFNPNQLSLTRSASWVPHVTRGAESAGIAEFSGSDPRTLSIEFFLNAKNDQDKSLPKTIDVLLSCCVPTQKSITAKTPSPPWVHFTWGQHYTVSFYAYVSQVSTNYVKFAPDGTPTRATCSLTLHEIGGSTPGQNPTSGGLSGNRVHRFVAGDSLELLAFQEYGDPTAWRAIAEANWIDDPIRLRPVTEVLVPAADELSDSAWPEPR